MTNSYSTVPGSLFRKFLFASLALVMSVLYSVSSWGQAATYNVATTAGAYSAISGGTVYFATGVGYDDNISGVIAMPNFTYNGLVYNAIKVNTNGWVALGQAAAVPTTAAAQYTPLSTAVAGSLATTAIIAPFGCDQNNTATSEIRYEDTGTEFVVQWANVRRYNIAGESLSYQLRLNYSAATNVFAFVYGTMTPGAATAGQVGHKNVGNAAGVMGTTMSNLTIKNIPAGTSCTWANAVSGRLISETMLIGTTAPLVTCPSGTTFTWTPQSGTIVNPVTIFAAVSAITTTGATIGWTAPTNASQYDVEYRRTAPVVSCNWTSFSVGQAGTTAALTGLLSSSTYQVRVRSRSLTNNCRFSHIPPTGGGTNTDGYIANGSFITASPPPVVTSTVPASNYCSVGGQTVVITGTDFVAVTAITGVRFNGVNAPSWVVNNSTQITAVTPVGITAGVITITTASGSNATYAYVVNTNPVVTVNSPSVCGAYPTALTAAGASTYAWSPSTMLSSNTGNPVTLTASGATAITVTGTDAFGCTGTAVSTVTFSVAPYVAITPSIQQFCGGGGLTTVSASSVNDPNYAYAFTSLESGVLSNVLPTSADMTVTQSAAIRVTATDNVAFCSVQRDTSISVYAFPTLAMSATPNTICQGQTSVLGSGLSAGAFSVGAITYAPLAMTGATTLVTAGVATPALTSGSLDDGGWASIPIGFTLNFLGTNYTTVNVGTNGVMQFGAYNAGALGDYIIGALPNVVDPLGAIFMGANDLYLTSATNPGSIKYYTTGYAPNRKFVMEYKNVPTCCGVANPQQTLQVILFETTGICEIHVEKALGGNAKTIGIQNSTGTVGTAAPGRQANPATIAVPEAWRFTPPANYTTTWTPAIDISGLNTGTNLFTRTTNALGTPGANVFTLVAQDQTSGCNNGAGDPVTVTVLATPPTVSGSEISAYGSVLGIGSATTVSPLVICGDQTVTATCTTTLTGPEVVQWWSALVGGTLLFTGPTYTTPTITPGASSVWAVIYNGVCSSAVRTQFDVTNNTPPLVTILSLGPDLDVNCGVGPTYAMNYQAVSGNDPNYLYNWTFDGNAIAPVDFGLGAAALSATQTTNSTVMAFDGVTGCSTTQVKAFSIYAFPSVTPTAVDPQICVGGTTTVNSGVVQGNFSVACSPFGYSTPVGATTLASGGVAVVPLSGGSLDDGGWAAIPFGFSFDFFGTIYTSVNVGTNGNVQFGAFNPSFAGGLGDFTFAGLPSPTEPLNIIAAMATDTYLVNGGSVRYWTTGVAPNLRFVLEYNSIPGWTNDGLYTAQLILHQTTGLFEVHCDQATGGQGKTIGVNNSTGLIGATAPRCNVGGQFWNSNNATIINAFPWAWTFTPPVNYTFDWSASAADISGPTNTASVIGLPATAVPAVVSYDLTITDNTSGCTNAIPFSALVTVVAVPTAPSVDGQGLFSATLGTNIIPICGDQTVTMNVSSLHPGLWTAHYYSDALLTTQVFLANPYTAPYTTGTITANTSFWVTLDNGDCEGPAQQVDVTYQVPQAITVLNSNPINCGPGPFSSALSASAVPNYTNYNWAFNANLSTLIGANTNATNLTQTTVFVVTGDDGFCYNSQTVPVSVYAFPVVTPTSTPDSICPGGSTLLNSNAVTAGFSVTSQGYSPQSQVGTTFLCNTGVQTVPLSIGSLDDGGWFNIPIPFTMNFFGNNYTTCNIGTNGNIQFGPTAGFSTSFSPGAIPSALAPNNYVAAPWADLYFATTGSIRYWSTGVSPNQVFCVLWDGPRFFNVGNVTVQAEIYESTGNVEIHIQDQTNPNGSNSIVGVEDLTGTIGSAAPGRTGNWAVVIPEGWLFSPAQVLTYDWQPAAEITGANNLPQATATPIQLFGVMNYTLNIQDVATTCTNSYNVPVTVSIVAPTVNFNASPLIGTSGGVTTTHVFNNTTVDIGVMTYAWTFSPATVAYVNATTAASKNPQVQFLAPGIYTVTCSATNCNGSDSQTNVNYFTITPEYCFPTFAFGCTDDMVDEVTVQDPSLAVIMAHLGTGCTGNIGAYEEFAPIAGVTSCTFYQGSTYSITVDSDVLFNEYFGVWMDVNNDGDFADAGEFMGGNAVPAITATFVIGIPSENVIYGAHKMRVIADYSGQLLAGDYCVNSLWGETHDYTVYVIPPVQPNDIPTFATNVAYSSNQNYPNCYALNGSTALATNSPESTTYTGNDVWYRFVAQSTAVSITMTSAVFDDVIELYTKVGFNYIPVVGGTENASGGNGDFERMNIGGLTPGTTYFVSVGSVNNSGSGAFTLCIQQLMKSWCAYTIPVGGFGLCDAYKAIYRGAPAQGVTYNFTFTGTGGGAPVGPTAITGTNGLTTLSQAVLALRYGGIYNAQVDVVYTLNNSAGPDAPITVLGTVSSPNCTGVTIKAQPLIEVKLSQRCTPLLRSSYLIGTPVSGGNACTAINYTFSFAPVAGCNIPGGVPVEYTTAGNTPYLFLANLPLLGVNAGTFRVNIRPNFTYGLGTYGPDQWVIVNQTAVSPMLPGEEIVDNSEKSLVASIDANLYPNPNNGEMVNLNVSGVQSDNVFVRILDAMGRAVYTNRFTVDGSLNTIVTFAQPLASGLYNVEFTVDGQVMTERMMVTK